jgi:hypothetical protein
MNIDLEGIRIPAAFHHSSRVYYWGANHQNSRILHRNAPLMLRGFVGA